MFSPSELNQLISGGEDGGVDVNDMQRCARLRSRQQVCAMLGTMPKRKSPAAACLVCGMLLGATYAPSSPPTHTHALTHTYVRPYTVLNPHPTTTNSLSRCRYAQYGNGYNSASHTVRLFWQVVADFTPTQRGMLLRFITSSSRAPLGGFKHLQPPLTIAKVDCGASPLALLGGKDVDRLPSASTCFNTLKLPNYRRGVTLRRKLLDAISAGAGFELS